MATTEHEGRRGSHAAVERDAPLHVEDEVVSATTSPDGTSASGQSYNEGTVRTTGSMARAIIGLVVVLAVIFLLVLIFALR